MIIRIQEGGVSEDNLPKVERAFIFDYTKNYDDYCSAFQNLQSFNSCIIIADIMTNDNYVNIENIFRLLGMMGFTVSSLTCENDNSFNTIKEYMIEVPVKDFYGLSNNNRVYFCRNDLSIQEQVKYITELIADKFPNIKEGEEFIPNGYIIPIPAAADDWGVITGIKKVNNKYMICGVHNGQLFDYRFIDRY